MGHNHLSSSVTPLSKLIIYWLFSITSVSTILRSSWFFIISILFTFSPSLKRILLSFRSASRAWSVTWTITAWASSSFSIFSWFSPYIIMNLLSSWVRWRAGTGIWSSSSRSSIRTAVPPKLFYFYQCPFLPQFLQTSPAWGPFDFLLWPAISTVKLDPWNSV